MQRPMGNKKVSAKELIVSDCNKIRYLKSTHIDLHSALPVLKSQCVYSAARWIN